MPETSRLYTRSLREQVYDFLREEMNRGGLKPGGFLDLNELAQRLGISRTPLRDALLQLEAEGFVSILPRRGFRLNALSIEDIRHFYEIIGSLEAAALLSVAEELSEGDLETMRRANEAMREAIAAGDFDRFHKWNLMFHDVFLERSPNRRLVALVQSLKRRLYDWPRRPGILKAWEERSVEEHDALIAHLQAGQPEQAAAQLREVHWSYTVQEPFIHAYYTDARGTEPPAPRKRRPRKT
jgi:DNA-binding GntR family transcriptional regulator